MPAWLHAFEPFTISSLRLPRRSLTDLPRGPEFGKSRLRPSTAFSSDVVHLFLARAFVEELLEGDGVGRVLKGLLQFLPGRAQLGWALGVAQGGGIEHLPVNGPQDVAEGDTRRRPGQQITAFLSALALDDMLGLHFNQNLDQVIGGHTLLARQFFHAARAAVGPVAGQTKHRAGGVVALYRKLHAAK